MTQETAHVDPVAVPPWLVVILGAVGATAVAAITCSWSSGEPAHPDEAVLPIAAPNGCRDPSGSGQRCDSSTTTVQPPRRPDDDDRTATPRQAKLGLAGREANWRYADYERHELNEAFDRAAKAWPKWRTFSIPKMLASVTKEPIAAL